METGLPSLAFNNFASLFRRGENTSARTVATAAIQSQTTTGVSILTAEGDRVTLRSQSTFQGKGISYNARGVLDGQAVQLRGKTLEGQFTRQQEVIVEGDLNEQEIQDIQDVLKTVNSLKRNVSAGNIQGALAKSSEIEATGSLAAVGVQVEFTESSSIFNRSRQTSSQIPSRVSTTLAAPREGTSAPSTSTRVPTPQPAISLDRSEKAGRKEEVDRSFKEPKEASGNRLGAPVAKGDEGFGKFLERVTDKIVERVEKIGKLAEKLERKVEKQADKLVNLFQKIGDLVARGKGDSDKADRLRDKFDHRLERLGRVVEKFTSKIQEQAEKLGKVLDSVGSGINGAFNSNASVKPEESSSANASPTLQQKEPQKEAEVTV